MVEQINAPELKGKIPVRAFLSYRQKIPMHANVVKPLEACCENHSIKLVYDQNGINEGGSIIAFMHEGLGAARCVFILLSPEYFESAYTLFELVSIHQWADLDKRFILPVRVSKNMSAYEWTAAEKFWWDDKNEAIRNELIRLLKQADILKEDDYEAAWQKVKGAWDEIISKFLDSKHPSLEEDGVDDILLGVVSAAWKAADTAVQEEIGQLHKEIQKPIKRILENNPTFFNKLTDEIGDEGFKKNPTAEEMAIYLVRDNKVKDALINIINVVEELEVRLKSSSKDLWHDCYYDAEQLCGWLFLNTVDPVWWFNHQLKIKQADSKNMRRGYSLVHPPYVEVIISRSLLKPALYDLDEKGRAKPANKNKYDVMLFDSISPFATSEQVLGEIYKDLFRLPKKNLMEDKFVEKDLINGIKIRAKNIYLKNGKPVYYLMEQSIMQLIEDMPWFIENQRDMAEYLQFVCCNVAPKNDDQSPCSDQEAILDMLAMFLSLREKEFSYA